MKKLSSELSTGSESQKQVAAHHPQPVQAGYVALAGRPNVGKSTLLNQCLGSEISIVTPKAQTTREKVFGIYTNVEATRQIVFVDTPGLHKAREGGINAFMVGEAREALETADLIWYLVDPASHLEHEQLVVEHLKRQRVPVFVIFNKADLKHLSSQAEYWQKELLALLEKEGVLVQKVFHTSALRKKGVDELLAATWEFIPEAAALFYEDTEQLSDRPVRYFVAEKIREQLFLQLGDELPYSCAVEVQSFKDPNETSKITRIEAMIHVERESQKGMVIGQKGQKIKEIGQRARLQIEEFLERPVFLGLKVECLKDWTRDPKRLEQLGYLLPGTPRSPKSPKNKR